MENCSSNECNTSYHAGGLHGVSPIPYIVISVVHMVVVIVPTISLGAIILHHVRADKEMRDPVTILFCAVTVTSMLPPSVFGLLIDISIFTDIPLLGSCSSRSRVVTVGIIYFLAMLTPNQIALITCSQCFVIKYGKKKITTGRLLFALSVLMTITAVTAFVLIIPSIGAFREAAHTIRGSFCKENRIVQRHFSIQSAVLYITVILCPFTLVVVSSVRSYLTVKHSTMETDQIVRSVLLVSAAKRIFLFVLKIPFIITFHLSITLDIPALLFFTIIMADIEYSFVLLLCMTTHRGIRNAVFSKVHCIRNSSIRWLHKTSFHGTSETVTGSRIAV